LAALPPLPLPPLDDDELLEQAMNKPTRLPTLTTMAILPTVPMMAILPRRGL
jgi:hypothetical protein